MLLFLLGLVVVGVGVAAAASSKGGAAPSGEGATDALVAAGTSPHGPPAPSAADLAAWTTNKGIDASKLTAGGQKFIDPYGIVGGCWPATGRDYLLTAPNNAVARVARMKAQIDSSSPAKLPLLDVLTGASKTIGLEGLGDALAGQIFAEIHRNGVKLKQYAMQTGNAYAIAFASMVAWLWDHAPEAGNTRRMRALAADASDQSSKMIGACLANAVPVPWHTLEAQPDSIEAAREVAAILTANAYRFAALPPIGIANVQAWFVLLLSQLGDPDVQRAMVALNGGQWGGRNFASDDQVYLVGLTIAKAAKLDPQSFIVDLWNAAKGWAAYPALLTNSIAPSLTGAPTADGMPVFGSDAWAHQGKWLSETPDPDTGMVYGAACVTNAVEVQWMDVCVTAWALLRARGIVSAPDVTPGNGTGAAGGPAAPVLAIDPRLDRTPVALWR